MAELGVLQRVALGDVWPHEAHHFAAWLAQPGTLATLSDVLGLELELTGQEAAVGPVGPYAADIVCKDTMSSALVLIENQLENTDHRHLGQVLTYAAGLKAQTIIWIASKFTDEHRAAMDWLNTITQDEWRFFGLEIELWRIGASPPAPKFSIICQPNEWSRAVRGEAAKAEARSPTQALQLRFWSGFRDRMLAKGQRAPKPSAQSWQSFGVGRTGFSLQGVVRRAEQQLMVRLYIHCGDLPPKVVFRHLRLRQHVIRAMLGFELTWNDLPGKKGSVVCVTCANCPLDDESRWPEYQAWIATMLAKMDGIFRDMIKTLQPEDLLDVAQNDVEGGNASADAR